MTFDSNTEMREFMALVETYIAPTLTLEASSFQEESDIKPNDSESNSAESLLMDLHDLVFKLRSHIDEELEAGFERAAEMIENLIRRYEGN